MKYDIEKIKEIVCCKPATTIVYFWGHTHKRSNKDGVTKSVQSAKDKQCNGTRTNEISEI